MKIQVSLKDTQGGAVYSHIASFVGGGIRLSLTVKTTLVGYSPPVFIVTYGKKETEYMLYEEAVAAYNLLAEPHESPRDNQPMRFKVGDRVAFVNQGQDGYGKRIDAVDTVHRKVRTDTNQWWSESNFMPWEEWESKYGPRR